MLKPSCYLNDLILALLEYGINVVLRDTLTTYQPTLDNFTQGLVIAGSDEWVKLVMKSRAVNSAGFER